MPSSPRLIAATSAATAFLFVLAACSSFGEDGSKDPTEADAGNEDDGASPTDTGTAPPPIRCGDIACPASTKCCLPHGGKSPRCVDRGAICGSDFGELLCSNPAACNGPEVCCVTVEGNGGQTAFDIARSFCVAASACPDGPMQHALCELGATPGGCTDGKACKPYLHDVNDQRQDLEVEPAGYATCQ